MPSAPIALILVDHGSRLAEANQLLESVAERMRARGEFSPVAVAHMGLAPPTLADAFAACARAGARRDVIVPYVLAAGSHATGDIPRLAREAAAPFPDIAWALAEPLGLDDRLVDLAADRARAAAEKTARG